MSRLLWIDLEMTGLDVAKEVIIEVAAIVTDYDFNEFGTYHAIVKQDQEYLDAMDDWNKKHHAESGLVKLIPSGLPPDKVETDLILMADRHFPEERIILAGNSIGQDRLFIDKYFSRFAERLHYRMLDVTSWKILFQNKYNLEYTKANTHRALDDVRESIHELQYYLQHFTLS